MKFEGKSKEKDPFKIILKELKQINVKLGSHDKQFAKINTRLDGHDKQFAKMGARFDIQDIKFAELAAENSKRDAVAEARFEYLKQRLQATRSEMRANFSKVHRDLKVIRDQTALNTEHIVTLERDLRRPSV